MNPYGMIYDIVSASRTDRLEMAVQKLMDEGWLPQGGICFAKGNYHQTMIKAGDALPKDVR